MHSFLTASIASGLRSCFFLLLLVNYSSIFALFRHTLPYFVIPSPISSYLALLHHTLPYFVILCPILLYVALFSYFALLHLHTCFYKPNISSLSFVPSLALDIVSTAIPSPIKYSYSILLNISFYKKPFTARGQVTSFRRYFFFPRMCLEMVPVA